MTQLQRPRSGDPAGARRGDDVSAEHGVLGLRRHHGLEHGRVPSGGVPLATQGRMNGATLIHVDPRFTRTSANCDIHAPIRRE